jgi:RimJ/RimL family protein N-acetyltransferase/acyl carrier protein
MLTKDEFEEFISERTNIPRASVDSGARLDTDMGLDSFGLLELATSLAEFGVELDEREWLTAETVGGLYDHYRERVERFPMSTTAVSPKHVDGAGQLEENELASPRLAGKFFRLVPVMPQAAPFLYSLAVSPDVGFRWRYRGSIPPYQQFEQQDMWHGILAQFLVESIQTNQPAGHVMCYNPDLNLGHAYIGAAMAGQYLGSGIAAEPVRLFINYLFDVWTFRKLYLELPEFNYTQFASAGGQGIRVEARLRDHDYYRNRRWDRLILAIYRPGEDAAASDAEFSR